MGLAMVEGDENRALSDEALAFMLRPALQRGRSDDASIPVITETALKLPEVSDKVRREEGDRRSLEAIVAEHEAKRAISVGLAQPHRKAIPGSLLDATNASSDFARLATPLGRFCIAQKLRGELYQAGEDYAIVVQQARIAMGLVPPDGRQAEGGIDLTEAQKEAIREGAKRREREVNAVLVAIHSRAKSVMQRLCCDQREVAPNDEGLAIHALMALAVEFGLIEYGINRGKV